MTFIIVGFQYYLNLFIKHTVLCSIHQSKCICFKLYIQKIFRNINFLLCWLSKHSNLWKKKYLFPFPDDLSYNKIATQLPIYQRNFKYEANNALDRNMRTCMRTQAIGLSSYNNSMWWKVDLGGWYNVYRITIMFRSYEEQSGILTAFSTKI